MTDPNINPEIAWLDFSVQPAPSQAMTRIRQLCEMQPDLHRACLLVLATHQSVPRPILAAALQGMRPELRAMSVESVNGLLTALWTGGQQGFEAVLRTRKSPQIRVSAGLPWLNQD